MGKFLIMTMVAIFLLSACGRGGNDEEAVTPPSTEDLPLAGGGIVDGADSDVISDMPTLHDLELMFPSTYVNPDPIIPGGHLRLAWTMPRMTGPDIALNLSGTFLPPELASNIMAWHGEGGIAPGSFDAYVSEVLMPSLLEWIPSEGLGFGGYT